MIDGKKMIVLSLPSVRRVRDAAVKLADAWSDGADDEKMSRLTSALDRAFRAYQRGEN